MYLDRLETLRSTDDLLPMPVCPCSDQMLHALIGAAFTLTQINGMHAAGAPAPRTTFFCDGQRATCFNYSAAQATFAAARSACQAQGGDLFMPKDARKQLLVEIYFRWGWMALLVWQERHACMHAAGEGRYQEAAALALTAVHLLPWCHQP